MCRGFRHSGTGQHAACAQVKQEDRCGFTRLVPGADRLRAAPARAFAAQALAPERTLGLMAERLRAGPMPPGRVRDRRRARCQPSAHLAVALRAQTKGGERWKTISGLTSGGAIW